MGLPTLDTGPQPFSCTLLTGVAMPLIRAVLRVLLWSNSTYSAVVLAVLPAYGYGDYMLPGLWHPAGCHPVVMRA